MKSRLNCTHDASELRERRERLKNGTVKVRGLVCRACVREKQRSWARLKYHRGQARALVVPLTWPAPKFPDAAPSTQRGVTRGDYPK